MRHDDDNDDAESSGDVNRRLAIVVGCLSVVASIFLAGYNWHEVTSVRAEQANYQKKDVAEAQYQNVMGQLEAQRQQMLQLQASMNEMLRGRKE